MCLDPDNELEGQVSINELLIAMGEAPIEPILRDQITDEATPFVYVASALPGL
ncbi:hypothetical protein IV500_05675 [Paeniglutamicibacter antarcticus]|uniref:Uncharacterized protein n=1 Tax=Arthrobacter terrae TaxID=2935737 RepID=A0A931G3Q0_9MICC|nr:hypothetical protein [Arthrobacter terrae]MBG0738911.1 hypothetical protein [Arthrobacter terrae]